MSNKLVRLLILVAVVVLVAVVLIKVLEKDNRGELLTQTVNKRWTALQNDDWVTIYEMMNPKRKKVTTLTAFLQGKNLFFYKNAEILEIVWDEKDKNKGWARIKHDWGANLEAKPDIGEAVKRGVILKEFFEFDKASKAWYLESHHFEMKNPPAK
jgi:hypothetical protein